MRILVIDSGSNALDLCMRWQQDGHAVVWWDRSQNGTPKRAGEGIVKKVDDFSQIAAKWMDWADMVYLPDNVHYIAFLEPYRLKGYPIFGPGIEATKLELDREAGQESMRRAGMKLISSQTFHDYDDATAFVKKEGRAFVSKPSGDADKALSYVAHDAADMVFMLQRWKANPDYKAMVRRDGFIIQEKVVGAEMAVGGYFGPHGWNKVFFENWENKKLMNGDLGPNTGEMGTLVRPVKRSKLAEQVLLPFTAQLRALKYVGYVDNNCIIDDSGQPWPLEWTLRDPWPMRHNITSLVEGDQAQWMLDLIKGRDSLKVRMDRVSVSIVMALPPFPYQHTVGKDVDGIPIYNGTDMGHVHLSEARMAMDVPVMVGDTMVSMPNYVCTGVYPLVVTGEGDTISSARRSAHAAIRKVKIPNSAFYRTDIGVGRMVKQLPALQKRGYAANLEM